MYIFIFTAQDGWSALWLAAHYGRAEILKMLLANGAKIESTDNVIIIIQSMYDGESYFVLSAVQDGWTALISAAANGQTEAAACLLQAGAAMEARDEVKCRRRNNFIWIDFGQGIFQCHSLAILL